MATSTRVSAPARPGTILARMTSSQPSCRASWNRCRRSDRPPGRVLPQGFQDRPHRRRALRRQVPGDPPRIVHRRVEPQAPLTEPRRPRGRRRGRGAAPATPRRRPGRSASGHPGPPRPPRRRAGSGRPARAAPRADAAGPAGDLPRPRSATPPGAVAASRRGCGPGSRICRTVALASLRPAGLRGQPGGGAGVPVGVVGVVGVEPGQERRLRGGQPGRDPPERSALPRTRPRRARRRGGQVLRDPRPARSASATLAKPPPEAARAQPAPSAVHITNHPSPRWVPAGRAVLGGRRGCVCYVLLTLGCLPLPTDYPFDRSIIKSNLR